jgi:hypothetical protein
LLPSVLRFEVEEDKSHMMTKENQNFHVLRSLGKSLAPIIGLITIISICGGCGSGTVGSELDDLPKLNATSRAFPQKPAIAFNIRGDALAVWSVPITNSDNSMRVLYRIYLQTAGTWSAETELALTSSYGFDVGSNGTDFMVVWTDRDLWAREFDTDSGSWGKTTLIAAQTDAASAPQIDAEGNGYIVKRNRYEGGVVRVYANIYDGKQWHTAQASKPLNGLALNR